VKSMKSPNDLNEWIQFTLRRDEVIVLQFFLARELGRSDANSLRFAHRAEELSLEGLLHELDPRLPETGGPDGDAIYKAAIEHLMARFQ
jgi:hypothetical protein